MSLFEYPENLWKLCPLCHNINYSLSVVDFRPLGEAQVVTHWSRYNFRRFQVYSSSDVLSRFSSAFNVTKLSEQIVICLTAAFSSVDGSAQRTMARTSAWKKVACRPSKNPYLPLILADTDYHILCTKHCLGYRGEKCWWTGSVFLFFLASFAELTVY